MKVTGNVTIEIDGKKITLTMDKARELRNSLSRVLGEQQSIYDLYPPQKKEEIWPRVTFGDRAGDVIDKWLTITSGN